MHCPQASGSLTTASYQAHSRWNASGARELFKGIIAGAQLDHGFPASTTGGGPARIRQPPPPVGPGAGSGAGRPARPPEATPLRQTGSRELTLHPTVLGSQFHSHWLGAKSPPNAATFAALVTGPVPDLTVTGRARLQARGRLDCGTRIG